jgi:hypothetical protein
MWWAVGKGDSGVDGNEPLARAIVVWMVMNRWQGEVVSMVIKRLARAIVMSMVMIRWQGR